MWAEKIYKTVQSPTATSITKPPNDSSLTQQGMLPYGLPGDGTAQYPGTCHSTANPPPSLAGRRRSVKRASPDSA